MELQEVLTLLGIPSEKATTIDALKSEFEKEFVRIKNLTVDSEAIKPIVGKILNEVNTNIKAAVKPFDAGIDFESDEWKNADTKTRVKMTFDKIAGKHKTIVDDLTTKASQNNDQKVKDLEESLRKANEKYGELEGKHGVVVNEYSEFKNNTLTAAKNNTLNGLLKGAKENVKFIAGVTKVQMLGFDQSLATKYDFDLDESGKSVVVKDKATGKPIPSKKVANESKKLDEILEDEAIELELFEANGQGGKEKPNPKSTSTATKDAKSEEGKAGRVVAKRFGRD